MAMLTVWLQLQFAIEGIHFLLLVVRSCIAISPGSGLQTIKIMYLLFQGVCLDTRTVIMYSETYFKQANPHVLFEVHLRLGIKTY